MTDQEAPETVTDQVPETTEQEKETLLNTEKDDEF